MVPSNLRWFPPHEFQHPDLVDEQAVRVLDEVREQYGFPIILTDDARLPGEAPSGASPMSLHYMGRAFDLVFPPTREFAWELLRAIVKVQEATGCSLELELVNNPGAILKAQLEGERGMALVRALRAARSDLAGQQLLLRAMRADRHFHIGVFPDARPSRLIVALD
jgi:hypothetical protein